MLSDTVICFSMWSHLCAKTGNVCFWYLLPPRLGDIVSTSHFIVSRCPIFVLPDDVSFAFHSAWTVAIDIADSNCDSTQFVDDGGPMGHN